MLLLACRQHRCCLRYQFSHSTQPSTHASLRIHTSSHDHSKEKEKRTYIICCKATLCSDVWHIELPGHLHKPAVQQWRSTALPATNAANGAGATSSTPSPCTTPHTQCKHAAMQPATDMQEKGQMLSRRAHGGNGEKHTGCQWCQNTKRTCPIPAAHRRSAANTGERPQARYSRTGKPCKAAPYCCRPVTSECYVIQPAKVSAPYARAATHAWRRCTLDTKPPCRRRQELLLHGCRRMRKQGPECHTGKTYTQPFTI
jgi:hypothetical protein